MSRSLLAGIVAVLVAACTVSASPTPSADPSPSPDGVAPAEPSAPPPAASPTPSTVRTVDPTIEPVSASAPSPDARKVMELCLALKLSGEVDVEHVAGMGLIPHARDAVRYVPLTGREPELETDEPAWLIQLRGEILLPRGFGTAFDPTCVVVGGDRYLYITGPIFHRGETTLTTPLPIETPPDLLLPPLAP
jgi:hypothetical protein